MRQLIIPLGTLLTVISLAACSSDDSSSGEQAPPPASQIKNDSPQQQQPQNQDANKSNPTQQTPVTQTPVQQAPAGYFEATSGSQRYLIPNSSLIAIDFPIELATDPDKNVSLPGAGSDALAEEKLPRITVAVKDMQGAPVFAAGSRLIGNLKMSAPKAIFNVTGVKYGSTVYNMAANAEVTSVRENHDKVSITSVIIGALGGAGIALLIDGLGSDRSITWWAPTIGAVTGGLAGGFLFKDNYSIVRIKANETAVLVPGPR
ncbi:MAG: hypothetical protein RL189_2471 [Pseudomonadota bacterium]|jgi:outer membrane lipoprotein SlyB